MFCRGRLAHDYEPIICLAIIDLTQLSGRGVCCGFALGRRTTLININREYDGLITLLLYRCYQLTLGSQN